MAKKATQEDEGPKDAVAKDEEPDTPKKGKKPKLGSGGRFKALVGKLEGHVEDPAAVSASIGRRKYGGKRMAEMSAAGRKK